MPTYDYRCDSNDRIVEVNHRMSHRVVTWGELCDMAGIETGETEATTPVVRLATGGNVVKSSALKNGDMPAGCNPEACGGVGCPMNG